jgi:hypothetical protein
LDPAFVVVALPVAELGVDAPARADVLGLVRCSEDFHA